MRPQVSRTQSEQQRGRSATKRNSTQGELKWDYQFRPAEVVKNIQKSSDHTSLIEKSRSREGSIARLKEFDAYGTKARSSSAASINYKPVPSKLGSGRNYRNPMSAYASHENIDTIVPNHSSILYQKYHRPSSTVNNSDPSSKLNTATNTPRSRKSVALPQDLLPAFENVNIDIDDDYKEDDDENNGEYNGLDLSEFDNKFTDSNPGSLRLGDSERSSINSAESKKSKEEDKPNKLLISTAQQRPVERHGRIQQRVNFMKELNDESQKPMSQKWTTQTFHQKLFLESLNNDLRSLKRSNHNPLYKTLKTNHTEHKVLDSSASISSQSLLKTLDSNSRPFRKEYTYPSKTRKCDVNRLKELLPKCHDLASQLWSEKDEPLPEITTTKKSSGGTMVSSFDSGTSPLNMVTHTYHPKEADVIHENFDGYVIDNSTTEETYIRVRDYKPQSPLSQRKVTNV